jgi:hypothetical protein
MKRGSDASVLVQGQKMARADKGAVWLGKVLEGTVDDANADPAFLASLLQQRSASAPLSKQLDYFSGCLARVDDLAPPAEMRDKVGAVKQAVAAEAYRALDEAGADGGPAVLTGLENRTLTRKLLKALLEKVGEKRPPWASAVVLPLIESLGSRVKGRTFSSLKEADVGTVSFIVGKKTPGEKLCAQLLTEASFFLPEPPESAIKKRANGAFYERDLPRVDAFCESHRLPQLASGRQAGIPARNSSQQRTQDGNGGPTHPREPSLGCWCGP